MFNSAVNDISTVNDTPKPLYRMAPYKVVWDIRRLKVDPKKVVSKQKCTEYIEKRLFISIFLYNLYSFIQSKQKCIDYIEK